MRTLEKGFGGWEGGGRKRGGNQLRDAKKMKVLIGERKKIGKRGGLKGGESNAAHNVHKTPAGWDKTSTIKGQRKERGGKSTPLA